MTEAVHPDPVWRSRADFVIGARLPEGSEQLWAKQLGEHVFELCCVPFFVYGLALGDVVETDTGYELRRVARRSGRSVFRVWFGDSPLSTTDRDRVAADLAEAGALVERSSANLLAVDAATPELADSVAAYLAEHAELGHLTFEVGVRGQAR
ncbi:DUF4265 domain-containing protein [Actinokineospora guangxiensis]|uniref:DUF4265 domain-containing protein n=1 Tax=Actinokineospora guangxiensis TaxID=1490288 RepID=A0ABW0EL16_9PSEU